MLEAHYLAAPSHLCFPDSVETSHQKILYALWREGAQCIASIAMLTSMSTTEVTDVVKQLAAKGRVTVDDPQLNPLTMCSLSKAFVHSVEHALSA